MDAKWRFSADSEWRFPPDANIVMSIYIFFLILAKVLIRNFRILLYVNLYSILKALKNASILRRSVLMATNQVNGFHNPADHDKY